MNTQTSIKTQDPEGGYDRRETEELDPAGRLKRLAVRLGELSSAVSRFGMRRTLRIAYASLCENRYALRLRLELFRLARYATFHRTIDVTDLWNRFHRHLAPVPQQPGALDAELLHCPGCGEKRAVRILAHVRLGARGWAPMRCILSCFACHHYSLPSHELLAPWVKTASRLLRARGTLTLIWRADGLSDVLAALAPAFGALAVTPVHPVADKPAIRVLVTAVKGSRAALALLPPLVLADASARPTAAAEAVLRDGVALFDGD